MKTNSIMVSSSSILPIFILHRGFNSCAQACVAQALFHYPGEVKFVHNGIVGDDGRLSCLDIEYYRESANNFVCSYRHISSNNMEYERFCFERWFIIKDIMQAQNYRQVIAIDSDVLLYPGVANAIIRLSEFEFSSWTHFAVVSLDAIASLCDYIMELFSSEKQINLFAERLKEKNKLSRLHLSDMDFFEQYASISRNSVNLNAHFMNLGIDPNISLSHGCEMHEGVKRIRWLDNCPVVTHESSKIQTVFSSLHLQGRAKGLVSQLRSAPLAAEPILLQETMAAARQKEVR